MVRYAMRQPIRRTHKELDNKHYTMNNSKIRCFVITSISEIMINCTCQTHRLIICQKIFKRVKMTLFTFTHIMKNETQRKLY